MRRRLLSGCLAPIGMLSPRHRILASPTVERPSTTSISATSLLPFPSRSLVRLPMGIQVGDGNVSLASEDSLYDQCRMHRFQGQRAVHAGLLALRIGSRDHETGFLASCSNLAATPSCHL